jgi:hypothetical protein
VSFASVPIHGHLLPQLPLARAVAAAGDHPAAAGDGDDLEGRSRSAQACSRHIHLVRSRSAFLFAGEHQNAPKQTQATAEQFGPSWPDRVANPKQGETMRITVVVQNLQHGGFADESGHRSDRWPLLRQRLQAAQPDVLILNEARTWTSHDHEPLGRAMTDLGMYAVPAPHTSNEQGTVILARWDTMGPWRYTNHDLSDKTVHGFTLVAFTIEHVRQPIMFAGTHINPYSPTGAIAEADLVVTRAYRKGSLAVIGGDFNFPTRLGRQPRP